MKRRNKNTELWIIILKCTRTGENFFTLTVGSGIIFLISLKLLKIFVTDVRRDGPAIIFKKLCF